MNTIHTGINLSFVRLMQLLVVKKRLAKRDSWTRRQLEGYQQQQLKELRHFAYRHSPFYKRFHSGYFHRPLHELPVLTKQELMANWNDVTTDNVLTIDKLRTFVAGLQEPLKYLGEYVISTTSGTTGLKGIFAFNQHDWLSGLASHGRATEWGGVKIGLFNRLRMAVVSSNQPRCKSLLVGASVDTPMLPTLRLDSTAPLNQIVDQLNEFQPHLLVSYAGTAKALAKKQVDGHLKIKPQKVFTSSEVLTKKAKQLISEAWGAIPYNAYASTETALIAGDCSYHQMHLCEDLVITEVVDKNNNPVPAGVYGDKLLVTVLFNKTVPLIRYEISDSIMLADASVTCACGRPFHIVSGIQGRIEDIIYLNGHNGKEALITPDIFHDVLEPAPVGGWQVTQENETSILVSIVNPEPDYKEQEVINNLTHRLKEQGALDPIVRLEWIDKLKQSATGKTPLVKALKRKN
jgi:phenylacetate-CoA ligase